MVMKWLVPFLVILMIWSCKQKTQVEVVDRSNIDRLAEEYVRLALYIGMYDESFVDAYYGPESLKPATKKRKKFPKDSILQAVDTLLTQVRFLETTHESDTVRHRAGWIADQLVAFDRRVQIFTGDYSTFDKESRDLFGVIAPVYDENHYAALIAELQSILPGKGTVQERFQKLANRFIIPKAKLDTVFKAAIEEARSRTKQYYSLPESESFTLEYVSDKPWNGYNWYKGNYTSLIQINTDLNIFIDRVIDVGSHESYPGHHVYNMLLEKNLYRDRNRVEISMYPLFSPQSLIAEGTANYGIDVVFPGDDRIKFAKEVLLPMAGLDTNGITTYFKAVEIKTKLNYARNEAARGIINGSMTDEMAQKWLEDYALYNKETAEKSIRFIKANRSYVINYNYGADLIREYVDSRMMQTDSTEETRWKIFGELMSRQVRINELFE